LLYARSIVCIGLLKLHLVCALVLALTQGARTVTETHLRATVVSEDRVSAVMQAAFQGEADLAEPEGSDERLLQHLGVLEDQSSGQEAETATKAGHEQTTSPSGLQRRRPGDRAPGRDPIGPDPALSQPESEEERKRALG
jgi:hypothetical protein